MDATVLMYEPSERGTQREPDTENGSVNAAVESPPPLAESEKEVEEALRRANSCCLHAITRNTFHV